MIMLCHHFIVSQAITSNSTQIYHIFADDDNDPAIPTLTDHATSVGERNPGMKKNKNDEIFLKLCTSSDDGDNRMDVEGDNQGIQHIPGVDDTTLLSNVSDEFVLPPILTSGENQRTLYM